MKQEKFVLLKYLPVYARKISSVTNCAKYRYVLNGPGSFKFPRAAALAGYYVLVEFEDYAIYNTCRYKEVVFKNLETHTSMHLVNFGNELPPNCVIKTDMPGIPEKQVVISSRRNRKTKYRETFNNV